MNRRATYVKQVGASIAIAIALIAPAAAHALGRRDLALGTAIVGAVVLMGVWGHVVVGAVIAVGAWLIGAGARLVTGKASAARGWSDWPGTAAARAEKQHGRHRPVSRRLEKRQARLVAHPARAEDPRLH